VLGVVLVIGVIAALVPDPGAAPAPQSSDGVGVAPADAYSSSSFCSAGTGTAATGTIELTNSTVRAVSGVMTTVVPATGSGAVSTVRQAVTVPPLSRAAVNPAAGLPAGSTASSLVFAGGGVVADQVVTGPNGWSTAPCASQTSPQWAFAGGSTSAGNALTLSLFNPAATEAVVNVTFVADDKLITPPQYQGLVVPAGQVLEENVGDFVQSATTIATLVTAQAGSVVSTEFQQWSSGATGGVSLQLGSPALSTTWRLAQTTTMPRSTVDVYLANLGTTPVNATISFGLSSGSVTPRQVVVPAISVVVFSASGSPGLPQQTPYSVTVTSSAPIAVGRSVEAPPGSTPPVWGSSSATVTVADRWLVPGPGVSGAPAVTGATGATADSLAVANPGPSVAAVTVTPLRSTRTVAMFTVPPGQVVVLGAKQVGGLSALNVTATQPVNVEEDSGPTGAPGVVSSTGFPFVG
jgi:hypothetical protein